MSLKRTIKELIRDGIAKSGLSRLHAHARKLRGENVDHLFLDSLSQRFSAIYSNRVWLNDRSTGSLSGLGSELENTGSIRDRLPEILASLEAKTLLDIGCGDFTWMKKVDLHCNYVGVDIVREVIEKNNTLYHSEQRLFMTLDATFDPLPKADVVLCREVMFHLSNRDIGRLIENIRKSGASFMIITNDNGLKYNSDILSGDFRMLNLHRAPFLFPTPAHSIPDDSVTPSRVLSVWNCRDVRPFTALK